MGDASGTANNDWITPYLEASSTTGLSSEYVKEGRSQRPDGGANPFAGLYASKVLQMTPEEINYYWQKASSTPHGNELSVRREQLSWRLWGVQYRKQHVEWLNAHRAGSEDEEEWLAKLFEAYPMQIHDGDITSGDEADMTPKANHSHDLSIVEEGDADAKTEKAEAKDVAQPLASTSSKSSSKGIEAKRSESMMIGRMRSINIDDTAVSGDLDAGRRLKINTQPSRALEAVMDPDSLQSPVADDNDPFAGRTEGLYICLISLHGLVRGDKMELGRDADTGGQVKYVVELARALSQHPSVVRVELLTRLIQDPKVAKDYGEAEECILEDPDYQLGGAYIVRLPCGDPKVYLRKEKLWPHTREFADAAIQHCTDMRGQLQRAGEPCELYTVHGHYADAGEVAGMVASTMAAGEPRVDMVMTGHSLGRNKLEHLLAGGTMSKADIEKTYKIERRIEGEERGLDHATMIFTSTQQEIDEQWGLYDGYNPKQAHVFRPSNWRRTHGRCMPVIKVVPPGLDFTNLKVKLPEDPNLKGFIGSKPNFMSSRAGTPKASAADEGHFAPLEEERSPCSDPGSGRSSSHRSLNHTRSNAAHQIYDIRNELSGETFPIWKELARFLRDPYRPAILAMSRPDAKKNITTLVQAFGENPRLRENANLVLIMGNRRDVKELGSGSQKVLNEVMYLIDLHDLYGHVAYPKAHSQSDISDIYRFAEVSHGIFVNPALQEPFGLTVIEAAAHGVPTVATKNGGPVDIMKTLHHGVTVDPTDSNQLGNALLSILTNHSEWERMSKAGIKNIHAYSWLAHSRKCLEAISREKAAMVFEGQTSLERTSHHTAERAKSMDLGLMPFARRSSVNSRRSSENGDGAVSAPMEREPVDMQSVGGSGSRDNRDAFIVVALDSMHCAPQAAVSLKQAVQCRRGGGGNIGLGILAMDPLDDVLTSLREADFDVGAEVDWVVSNGGADIHSMSQYGAWEEDVEWEEHIEWRWSLPSVAKALKTVQVSGATKTQLLEKLDSGAQGGGKGAAQHPLHLLMGLSDTARKALADKSSGGLAATTLTDRLRRNLRHLGYRCQVTLQLMATPAGWISRASMVPRFHVTPLRASRALALRFLGHQLGVSLRRFVVVLPAPAVDTLSDFKIMVGGYCGDLVDLCAGQPRVAVAIPFKAEPSADAEALCASDRITIKRIQTKLSKKLYGERVAWGDAADASTLEKLVQSLPQSSNGKAAVN